MALVQSRDEQAIHSRLVFVVTKNASGPKGSQLLNIVHRRGGIETAEAANPRLLFQELGAIRAPLHLPHPRHTLPRRELVFAHHATVLRNQPYCYLPFATTESPLPARRAEHEQFGDAASDSEGGGPRKHPHLSGGGKVRGPKLRARQAPCRRAGPQSPPTRGPLPQRPARTSEASPRRQSTPVASTSGGRERLRGQSMTDARMR